MFLALFIGFSPLRRVNYDLENLCKLLCGVCICTSDAFVSVILWVVFVSVDMCYIYVVFVIMGQRLIIV